MFQFSVFVSICCSFCTLCNSAQMQETVEDLQNEHVNSNENDARTLELRRRKEIAENYFNTLEKVKETWVDPYEMISYPVKEESIDENTVENSFNFDSDEEPLFSDIKGDIIGAKIPKKDNSLGDSSLEIGGYFSKDRQQICVLDSIYISRWLKMLILKVEEESDLEPSSVSFPLDANLLENLKDLSTAKSVEISQLDELICGMIAQATISRKESYDWTVLIDNSRHFLVAAGFICAALLFSYAMYQCIIYHPKLTILGCIVFSSIFWHWMHLYKQKQAHKHAELSSMKIPDQCRKFEFGLMEHIQEYFKSYFTNNNDCIRYYEALMVDPFWEVSFTVAASEAVSAMLFQPLSAASRVINLSLKQLFDGLSITIIIPLIIFLFLLLIMLCNYRIKLPFWMGAIEPSVPSPGSRIEDVQPNKALVSNVKKFSHLQEVPIRSIDSKDNTSTESLQDCCEETRSDGEEVGAISHDHCCWDCLSSEDIQHEHEECKVCKSKVSDENNMEVFETSPELLAST